MIRIKQVNPQKIMSELILLFSVYQFYVTLNIGWVVVLLAVLVYKTIKELKPKLREYDEERISRLFGIYEDFRKETTNKLDEIKSRLTKIELKNGFNKQP